jgi:hypothetical protein
LSLLTLQIDWKITLFPAAVRRVIFIVDSLLEPLERFIWPAAVIVLVRQRRASSHQPSNQALQPTAGRSDE